MINTFISWPCQGRNSQEDDINSYLYSILSSPWKPLDLHIPQNVPVEPPEKLREALVDLAEGTTSMGRPERVWPRPKYGVIADHKVGAEATWPPVYHRMKPLEENLPAMPSSVDISDYNTKIQGTTTKTVTPIPTLPTRSAQEDFEVQTYTLVLPPAMADFWASSSPVEPIDATIHDENTAPTFLYPSDKENKGLKAIPEPDMRGERKPLQSLYYDDECTPLSQLMRLEHITPRPSSVEYKTEHGEPVRDVTGWERLRPKAPPAINMAVIEAANKYERKMAKYRAAAKRGRA